MPEFELDDPRPIAASARYTFFLPTPENLEAVEIGDLIKATFRAVPQGDTWDAERMWVKVTAASKDWFEGTLESAPEDIKGLQQGAIVRVPRNYVLDIVFADPGKTARLAADKRRGYWERCLVDQCVLDGTAKVHYLYRKAPDVTPDGHKYPDSGWRIRGDMRNSSDKDLAARKSAYVALGAVLNRDDSWIHLIDEPVGSAFQKDFETEKYVRLK